MSMKSKEQGSFIMCDTQLGDLIIISVGHAYIMCIILDIHRRPHAIAGAYYSIMTLKNKSFFAIHHNEILANLTQNPSLIGKYEIL